MRHPGTLKAPRLKKVLGLLGRRPKAGWWMIELQHAAQTCNISADIADLRELGVVVDVRRRAKQTASGRWASKARLIGMKKPGRA